MHLTKWDKHEDSNRPEEIEKLLGVWHRVK